MTKKFLQLFFLLLIAINTIAQNPAVNIEKYLFYRERLVNDYMLVGDCDGCSIPAGIRGETAIEGNKTSQVLKWGDATIELGWYISVLATEYKVFTDHGQSTAQTIMELYYALKTFNRLDETAEAYMRCNVAHPDDIPAYKNCVAAGITPQQGDLNGFFIRDDVSTDLVSGNLSQLHFNQNLNSSIITVTTAVSDKYSRELGNYRPNQDLSPVEESVDQVLGMLMGLALVNKFVPPGVTYNNLPLNDVDYNADINLEARNITDRIVKWIRNSRNFPGLNPNPISTGIDNAISSWVVINPVNGECVANVDGNKHDCGIFEGFGTFVLMSHGLAEAAEKITGFSYHDVISLTSEPLWDAYQIGCPTDPDFYTLVYAPLGLIFGDEIASVCNSNYYLIAVIAAIGNSWKEFGINTTNARLTGWGAVNNYEWIPLLRQVLHGGGNGIPSLFYEKLLNEAPFNGPYKFSATDYPAYRWSSTNTLRQPDRRGDGNTQFLGEFYGMDYMLLLNLYRIINSEYGNTPPPDCTVSLFDPQPDKVLNVSQNIPGLLGNEELHYQNSITTQSGKSIVIKSGADVWWTAGNYIELNPSFENEYGAEFTAEIIDCNELFGKMANSGNSHNDNSNTKSIAGNKSISRTATEQRTPDSELPILPNPSGNGIFTLTGENVGSVTVYNILGETVYQSAFDGEGKQVIIDISTYPKGIYFVKVQTGSQTIVQKVVYQ